LWRGVSVYVDVVHDASWAVGSRQAVGVRLCLCGEPMTQAGSWLQRHGRLRLHSVRGILKKQYFSCRMDMLLFFLCILGYVYVTSFFVDMRN
jgi:hypothetical protein